MKRTVNIWTSLDWTTVALYVVLVILGWVNIYAAVYDEKHQSILDISQRYGKQLIWILAAFVLAFAILLTDSNFFSMFAWIVFGAALVFTASVLLFGTEVNGAKAWFQIGDFRLQPSEFMKFATNLALAKFLSTYNFQIEKTRNIAIVSLILVVPSAVILLQNDTGSALVYFAFLITLYREGLAPYVLFFGIMTIVLFLTALLIEPIEILEYIGGLALLAFIVLNGKLKNILTGIAIMGSGIGIALAINSGLSNSFPLHYILLAGIALTGMIGYLIARKKKIAYAGIILVFLISAITFTYAVDYLFNNVLEIHQRDRINELLGISSDPLKTGYNVNQSKIAIGSGGFAGKGFLQGTQTKYNFVPEQSTDFIFCTVGEEWGFLGSLVVIGLFTALLIRLVIMAERQRSVFGRIYGYGVASILFFHIVINLGMTIGLVPVIGIPLPFFSYGGSSLWSFTILLFIFIRLDASRMELLA
jgi:rod shape determining protein RodA